MSNLYLKYPSLEDEEKWYDYLGIDAEKTEGYKPDYTCWLEQKNNDHNGIGLEIGEYPSTVYFFMDEDKIVGSVSIRHGVSDSSLIGGHISFGIKSTERRKGYGTMMLHQALEKCEELDLEEVLLSCSTDDIGSSKVIENNSGVLKEIKQAPDDICDFKLYSINIRKALHKGKRKAKLLTMKKNKH